MASKAGEYNKQFQKDARAFCQQQGLTNECQVIDDMDYPLAWHLVHGGNTVSKPSWWFEYRAIWGNYIEMFQKRGKGWPSTPSWTKPLPMSEECYKRAAWLYLSTPEGRVWYERYKPDWLWLEKGEE